MKKWLSLTVVLAFCSIVYELLLASTLSLLTGSHIWWYSWTIAIYISGLAIGSHLASKKTTDTTFLKVELALAGAGLGSVVWVMGWHWIFYVIEVYNFHSSIQQLEESQELIKYAFFILTQGWVLLIGTLSGYEIPLIMREMKKTTGDEKENQVIAFNYLGTLLGTLVFSLGLYQHLDVITIGLVVGILNLLACIWVAPKWSNNSILVGLLILITAGGIYRNHTEVEQAYLKTRYFLAQYLIGEKGKIKDFFKEQDSLPEIKQYKTLYQQIDFVKGLEKDSKELKMFLDNNFQFSTETERSYHESFAHVALNLANTRPERVLVLGAGDGMLIRELLKHEFIKEIDHVELDDKILEMFKSAPLNELNGHALLNPKVKSQVGDGFYFVRNTKAKYDAVFIDFPYPKTYDLARLYSTEFYQNIRRILNPNGIAVMDVPLENELIYLVRADEFRTDADYAPELSRANDIVLSTLFYSGFKGLVPFKIQGESFMVMSEKNIKPNFKALPEFSKYFTQVTLKDLQEVEYQDFPYVIDRKYVNSIFFPKILQDWKLAPIY